MPALIKAATQTERHKLQGQQVCYLFTIETMTVGWTLITVVKGAKLTSIKLKILHQSSHWPLSFKKVSRVQPMNMLKIKQHWTIRGKEFYEGSYASDFLTVWPTLTRKSLLLFPFVTDLTLQPKVASDHTRPFSVQLHEPSGLAFRSTVLMFQKLTSEATYTLLPLSYIILSCHLCAQKQLPNCNIKFHFLVCYLILRSRESGFSYV